MAIHPKVEIIKTKGASLNVPTQAVLHLLFEESNLESLASLKWDVLDFGQREEVFSLYIITLRVPPRYAALFEFIEEK
jgi:hypothetical protein